MPSVSIIGTRGYPSYYGGFETAVRSIAPYLAERGWEVSVYGRRESPTPSRLSDNRSVRSVFTPGIESKSLSTLSYGLTSSLHAALDKPDVALVMNVANGYWLPLLRARGIPTVVNVDGLEWTREKWGRLARSVFYGGAKMTARFGDSLVFDANAIGEYWRTEFHRDGAWIPYGGSESPGRPFDEDFPAGEYVLAVARFVPENTVAEFLDAAERIAKRTHIVLVGSSGYGGELDERARDLDKRHDNFHWLGHMRDDERLFSLWANAGVYFHGHSVGGTNPALVQAMMLGAPILARDTVFNREVLDNSAHYTEPEPVAIATKLIELLEDASARKRLKELTQARARRFYTWDIVNSAYEEALNRALSSAKTPGGELE